MLPVSGSEARCSGIKEDFFESSFLMSARQSASTKEGLEFRVYALATRSRV